MTPRMHICQASVVRLRGELPFVVLLNGEAWGMFRHERDALLYMGEALSIPPQEILAAMREREVGER